MKGSLLSAVAVCCLLALTARAQAGAPPTISGFSPASGPVGSTVVIDGTGFVPPFSVVFAGMVNSAGSFTSTQIMVTVPSGAQSGPITVQTANGSAVTASDFVVGAATPTTPTVTLVATVPTASVSQGATGEYTLTLSTAPTADLVVSYKLTGSAVDGTDYAFLNGSVKFKPGAKLSKTIKIVPQGNLGGASKKTVKLTLQNGDGYFVGTTTFEKVKIVP